jgi:hypothetical protein
MNIMNPFEVMADKLDALVAALEDAARHSEVALHRPEMSFVELRLHFGKLAELYRQQLVHKALVTHRTFSVKKGAKQIRKPLSPERIQQLRNAGRKGGSKKGSARKSAASKANGAKRWRGKFLRAMKKQPTTVQ